MNNLLRRTLVVALLFFAACDNPPAEPPPPSDRVARPLQPVRIEVETSLREIEIEIERLEDIRADESSVEMLVLQPEQLETADQMIRETREKVSVDDDEASAGFERFRDRSLQTLVRYEDRLDDLRAVAERLEEARDKKKAPADAVAD